MISDRAIDVALEPLSGPLVLNPRTMVRRQLEAALPLLTRELFAWVSREYDPAVLFFDASAVELDVLLKALDAAAEVVLVPMIPTPGKTLKDCVLAQSPAELRRLLYAANGERFLRLLSENPL
ncbi:MAG TPA: hypothetical protein VGG42_18855 [Acidobacteriaceae bacterium]|jgi:hypothetical protein